MYPREVEGRHKEDVDCAKMRSAFNNELLGKVLRICGGGGGRGLLEGPSLMETGDAEGFRPLLVALGHRYVCK